MMVTSSGIRAVRFAKQQAPTSLAYSCALVLCLVYAVVMVHTPMEVYTFLPHDDSLYVELGRSLAEGKWLGDF